MATGKSRFAAIAANMALPFRRAFKTSMIFKGLQQICLS
jgi:hypothetical protein